MIHASFSAINQAAASHLKQTNTHTYRNVSTFHGNSLLFNVSPLVVAKWPHITGRLIATEWSLHSLIPTIPPAELLQANKMPCFLWTN